MDNDNQKHTIQTVAGHLESNKQDQRVDEWAKIRELLNPQAKSWDELAKQIPDAVVSGYDANTRSVVPKETTPESPKTFDKVTNLWHDTKMLDGRIAPFVLAPLGDEVHSAEDTYKFKLNSDGSTYKTYKADKSREGYVNAGSLDFVTIQNNTVPPVVIESNDKRYQEAHRNIPIEVGSERDHNVIVSPPSELAMQVDSFSKVKNHICKQLNAAAPGLATELTKLIDCPASRDTLLQTYQQYLAPQGLLNKEIRACESSSPDVQSPLTESHLSFSDGDTSSRSSVTSPNQQTNDSLTSPTKSITITLAMREQMNLLRASAKLAPKPDEENTNDNAKRLKF